MSLNNKKILVTLGPTWVPVDTVRVLSNVSSGDMGHKIIMALKAKGAVVTALEGPVTSLAKVPADHTYKFHYFDELKHLLAIQLKKNFAAVIHAAAVSDFRIKNAADHKIISTQAPRQLTLIKTEKLITMIKKRRPATYLVGFKLETTNELDTLKKRSRGLFAKAQCDLVVANSMNKKYQAIIVTKNMDVLAKATSRLDASRQLANILNKDL